MSPEPRLLGFTGDSLLGLRASRLRPLAQPAPTSEGILVAGFSSCVTPQPLPAWVSAGLLLLLVSFLSAWNSAARGEGSNCCCRLAHGDRRGVGPCSVEPGRALRGVPWPSHCDLGRASTDWQGRVGCLKGMKPATGWALPAKPLCSREAVWCVGGHSFIEGRCEELAVGSIVNQQRGARSGNVLTPPRACAPPPAPSIVQREVCPL